MAQEKLEHYIQDFPSLRVFIDMVIQDLTASSKKYNIARIS